MLKGVCLVLLCLYFIQWTEACNRPPPPRPPIDPFYGLPSSCKVQKWDRYDCGWPGINRETCNSRGCCFHTYYRDAYNCYYHKNTWGSWGGWGSCSKTCGGGSQSRYRSCLADGSCSGSTSQGRSCNTQQCPSTWGSWGGWSTCSKTCGGGNRYRYRSCLTGSDCPGSSRQYESCNSQQCPMKWGSWGGWSTCSKTCGGGSRYRSRSCLTGSNCPGPSRQYGSCNSQQCPREWSGWSGWSGCTRTCGETGIKRRTRTCSDGSGPICDGGATQIISCNYRTVCPGRHLDAVDPGKETLKALAKLSSERPQLISTLHKVATELRKEQHSADVHHIISSGTAVVGYVLMGISVISEVMTVGADTPLAVPLFTLGEMMASGGTIASVVGNIIDDLKKSSILQEADNVFDEDVQLSNNLQGWTRKMESVVQSSDPMIVGAGIIEEFGLGVLRTTSVLNLVKSATKEVVISSKKIPMIAETVTSKLAGAAFNVWDLVVASIHVAKGSPSEAANKIDKIADDMETENRVLQEKLQQLREHLLDEIKYNLKNQETGNLQNVEASLNILDTILNWNPQWINVFNDPNSGMTLQQFISTVLLPYFNEIGRKIEEERQSGNRPERMDVGIIAHGSIGSSLTSPNPWETNVLSSTPVSLHFATESLRSITFYQPWGSMLHANAAHRILTSTITPEERDFYEGEEYQNDPLQLGDRLMEGLEGLPDHFNRITPNTGGWIPTTWINPTPDNDPVLQHLHSLLTRFPAPTMFFVWYPAPVAIPAFVVTDAVALVGSLFHIEMDVHIVACLGLGSNVNLQDLNLSQYYSVVQILGRYPKIWMATGNAVHP